MQNANVKNHARTQTHAIENEKENHKRNDDSGALISVAFDIAYVYKLLV